MEKESNDFSRKTAVITGDIADLLVLRGFPTPTPAGFDRGQD